ncbi:hypothetical protein J5N97_019421 [Dioscorea zingiberensis]|uniref:Uncharacterized protein n=1 Tax=Dioscorea zingiberensis TaxID=325984 RepID=A0A9D5HCP6_9LILI|nr:hypothetical protein J5N97_019421 [Dioscorea zingiberensis]
MHLQDGCDTRWSKCVSFGSITTNLLIRSTSKTADLRTKPDRHAESLVNAPMASRLETTPLLLLLFMLFSISQSFASPSGSMLRRDLLAFNPASRKQAGRGVEPIPNCKEMASRAECERNTRWCRWCRSDALDDMCFGVAEAWRLPLQSCHCRTWRNSVVSLDLSSSISFNSRGLMQEPLLRYLMVHVHKGVFRLRENKGNDLGEANVRKYPSIQTCPIWDLFGGIQTSGIIIEDEMHPKVY